MSQLFTQIQNLQNKVNSFSDATDFHDPETASSSGATHFLSQPSTAPSPRGTLCRDSGLPFDTRNSMGTSGNVFESLLEKDHPQLSSRIHGIWHHLRADWDLVLRGNVVEHGRGTRRELHSSSLPTPRFNQGLGTLNPVYHCGVTYWCDGSPEMSDLGTASWKIRGLMGWKVNFKTEVCARSAFPHLTLHWIKEVEIAKSIDELMTSRSITGRTDFPTTICLMR